MHPIAPLFAGAMGPAPPNVAAKRSKKAFLSAPVKFAVSMMPLDSRLRVAAVEKNLMEGVCVGDAYESRCDAEKLTPDIEAVAESVTAAVPLALDADGVIGEIPVFCINSMVGREI